MNNMPLYNDEKFQKELGVPRDCKVQPKTAGMPSFEVNVKKTIAKVGSFEATRTYEGQVRDDGGSAKSASANRRMKEMLRAKSEREAGPTKKFNA